MFDKRHFIVANVSKAITCEYSQFLSSIFSHELANNSNLKRRKISSSGACLLCGKLQSQLHVFNNCTGALDRYT